MVKPMNALARLASALAIWLLLALQGGCNTAALVAAARPDMAAGALALSPYRTVTGGVLAAAGPAFGAPVRPGAGPLVKILAPTAIALRGNDLLVVDSGEGRIWRVDLALGTLSPLAGVPATPSTTVALGADLSAWVLDAGSRQVLRFSRDGRLLQTFRDSSAAPTPTAFALADGGATLLLADDSLRQWAEFRPVGSFATPVRPVTEAGQLVRGVDGLASAGEYVYLLDRGAGVVHRARRTGQVLSRLGEGDLKQPSAMAVDLAGRVFVLDAQDRAVKLLNPGQPVQSFDAAQLRVQWPSAIAVDERFLAVADRVSGQVVIHLLREGAP